METLEIISGRDFIVAPIVIAIILFVSANIKNKNRKNQEVYKYFMPAILVKIICSICVCLIHAFYYDGDTVEFYKTSYYLLNMLSIYPAEFFKILFDDLNLEMWQLFDVNTGIPSYYLFRDPKGFAVIKYVTPLLFICQKSFIGATILLMWICFGPIWRLYKVLCQNYPGLEKEFALAVIFMPSVAFWGSGLLKDTITLSMVCLFVSSVFEIVRGKKFILNWIYILFATYIIVTVKPYIIFAIVPGSILWLLYNRIKAIKQTLIRVIVAPLLVYLAFIGGYYILTQMNPYMGRFSMENAMQLMLAMQHDLKQDYYEGNYFEIGEFEPTLSGMLGKAHIAISASLFRPFIWEARNPLMMLSGIENTMFLILFLNILIRVGPVRYLKLTASQPYLLFSFIYVIILAFAVGMSTPNFGALVRYKIPFLPVFVSSLFIMNSLKIKKT